MWVIFVNVRDEYFKIYLFFFFNNFKIFKRKFGFFEILELEGFIKVLWFIFGWEIVV